MNKYNLKNTHNLKNHIDFLEINNTININTMFSIPLEIMDDVANRLTCRKAYNKGRDF